MFNGRDKLTLGGAILAVIGGLTLAFCCKTKKTKPEEPVIVIDPVIHEEKLDEPEKEDDEDEEEAE